MTNGEKMISAFPDGEVRKCEKGVVFSTGGWCHAYADEWWNAECEEPTTKNNLGVDCTPNTISFKEMMDDLKITAEDIENAEDLEYSIEPLIHPKNDLGVDCISREQALGAIRNLYPSMPRVDFNGSLRKWVDKYKPYIECDDAIKQLPSVTPKLSVPEVTALAEWTEKLTKGCEEAYNKGYADGVKAQEPRKGHWINTANPRMSDNIVCSECGYDSIADFKFCPCCGADMREV